MDGQPAVSARTALNNSWHSAPGSRQAWNVVRFVLGEVCMWSAASVVCVGQHRLVSNEHLRQSTAELRYQDSLLREVHRVGSYSNFIIW